ncbi:unnamed protein product [Schistosoma turkestanicum]|nr:unnamed protein product [Schistosoma turkestanicum]
MLMTITYLQLCFYLIVLQLNHISGQLNEFNNHIQQNQTISTFVKSLNQNNVIDNSQQSINYHVNRRETRLNGPLDDKKELGEKNTLYKLQSYVCDQMESENERNIIRDYEETSDHDKNNEENERYINIDEEIFKKEDEDENSENEEQDRKITEESRKEKKNKDNILEKKQNDTLNENEEVPVWIEKRQLKFEEKETDEDEINSTKVEKTTEEQKKQKYRHDRQIKTKYRKST